MFCEIALVSWTDSVKILDSIKRFSGIWAFRGQGNKDWRLSTRFERDAETYRCSPYWHRNRERYMIKEFQRRAHHFEQKLPDLDDPVEWLSYLQHHGGSTRLLDFTESFYIAAFFAMETSIADSAIWAVNTQSLFKSLHTDRSATEYQPYEQMVQRNKERANTCIATDNGTRDLVLLIDPFLQHERLWAQQGMFLFPCNRESPFEKNLCATFGLAFESLSSNNATKIDVSQLADFDFDNKLSILKIIIPHNLHPMALYDLRDMNITPATLFPGLDGFARSLNLFMRRFEETF